MLLEIAPRKLCVAASLAMALHIDMDLVIEDLFTDMEYPFDPPFDKYPKVPDMNVVADWAFARCSQDMIPFEYCPVCTPHETCKPVPVWYNGVEKFRKQLSYGEGVIECITTRELKGHMVAWDGNKVFDPNGYVYDFEDMSAYRLKATRFWLCT